MKTTVVLSLCLMVFSSVTTMAQEVKKYAIKSGYLKLELSGNTVGAKELWWDDFGNKTYEIEKSTTTTKIFGITNTEKKDQLTILVNDNYWTIDHISNTAYKGKVLGYQESQDIVNAMSETDREADIKQVMESMGEKNLGKETINNYKCDVYSIMGAKSWTYKGITLKSEATLLGIENNEMVSDFKPGMRITASQFTPPSNVDYEDITTNTDAYWDDMNSIDDDEDNEEPIIPLSYSYDKFKDVINSFSLKDYTNVGINSLDGRYASTFMKGLMGSGGTIMIVAESSKNMEESDFKHYEKFTHNGHKCYYGKMDEEEGTALAVEYTAHDMLIFVVGIPNMTKSELLKISDTLKF